MFTPEELRVIKQLIDMVFESEIDFPASFGSKMLALEIKVKTELINQRGN